MDSNSLLGIAQGIASMVAQNTNQPLPHVTLAGADTARFTAATIAGPIVVTVTAVTDTPPPPYDDGEVPE